MMTLINTYTYRFSLLFVLAVTLVLGACDSTNVTPENETEQAPVSISFAADVSSQASKAGPGEITDEAGNAILLSSVEVVLRKVKFKSEHEGQGEEREVDVGPVVVDIPLDDIPKVQFETELPPGIWEEIELEIDERRDEDELDFPRDVSIRVRGTWSPSGGPERQFTFESDVEGEREVELDPPLEIDEPKAYNITLMVKVDRWFRQQSGLLVDPASANEDGPNENLVEDNIENSFEGFQDDDRDGDEDDDSDDGEERNEVEVKGPIQELYADSLQVAGHIFRVNDKTEIKGEDDEQLTLSDLKEGDFVEVEGYYNDDDVLIAKEIELEDPGNSGDARDEVEVKGPIQKLYADSLQVAGRTFRVNDKTEIKGEDDEQLTLDDLSEGDFVEVEGHYNSDDELIADEIERDFPGDDRGDRGDESSEVEVKGMIDTLTDGTLTAAGITFKVTGETEIKGDDGSIPLSDLESGDWVKVEGYYNSDGELIAKEIKREDPDDEDREEVEIEGQIQTLTESSLTVAGQAFQVTGNTEIKGEDDEQLTLSDLKEGDYVEVEGYLDENDALIAEEIEREED